MKKKTIIITAIVVISIICILVAMHLHFNPVKFIMYLHHAG